MAQMTAQDLANQNLAFRGLTLQNGTVMTQQIMSEVVGTITAGASIQRNIPLRNVGLTKKLYIIITANIAQSAAETLTLQPFGLANLLSNVTFSDYTNYQRINTTGWHLDALATARRKQPAFSAFTTSNPVATGNIFSVKKAPASITTVQPVAMVYEIPFAYSDTNLQGAVLSQVLNGNAYLNFTINPTIVAATGNNPVQSVYQSSTAAQGLVTNFTYTIYQEYIDQLPQQDGRLLLPAQDLATVYGIYNTDLSGLAVNSDNPYSFTNYRQFLSLFAMYDNAGVLNAGTDINRFKLQAANMTNIFDVAPVMVKVWERGIIGDDFPTGSYYFDFRNKPIATSQNGNMQLLINPSTVTNSTSVVHLGLEYLALLNQVAQSGSILA